MVFSVAATPPHVGSRSVWMSAPVSIIDATNRAGARCRWRPWWRTPGLRGSSHRYAVRADVAADDDYITYGRPLRPDVRALVDQPDACGVDVDAVAVARIRHLGVAGDQLDAPRPSPRSRRLRHPGGFIEFVPSSRMNAVDSTAGCARAIARSFTVPLTARSPIVPPGKTMGFATYESVENARRAPPIPDRRIAHPRIGRRAEGRQEEVLDQLARHRAATAVAHHDVGSVAQRAGTHPRLHIDGRLRLRLDGRRLRLDGARQA